MAYYLMVFGWVSVPVVVWFVIHSRLPKWLSAPLYAAIIGVVFYGYMVASAIYIERKVESDIAAFDLVHAGNELTDVEKVERRQLFLKTIRDADRSSAPRFGAVIGFFVFTIIWNCILLINRVLNSRTENNTETRQ